LIKCCEAFDIIFKSRKQDRRNDAVLWTALKKLYRIEHEKPMIQPSILDTIETACHSDVAGWLEENESVFGGIDVETAPLLAPCLRLYDLDRLRLVRLSLDKVRSSLESQKSGHGAPGWDFETRSLGDELLSRLLTATQIRKRWMRSASRIFRPTYLRSKTLLKSIFPESVRNKDENLVSSLEQALEYEIQLRQDCRQYEQILRDLGLFEKVSNLPQHELLSNVDALIQQLDSVETILDAVSRCPLRQEAEQAIRSGQRDQILEFLESLKRGIKRQHHRQQSLQALHELSAWCRPDWQSGLEQKIKGDQPIISELEEIFAIWTSLVDAEKVILQHVPEFVVNKDPNQIGSLEQALEYEIQLRQDCRIFQNIRSDLGFSHNSTNLSQSDLLSGMHELLEQFDQVSSVVLAISECPLQIDASAVVRSGQPERISAFINSLHRGVRRQELRHRSRLLLKDLSLWCERNWLETLEQRIDSDQQVGVELEPVAQGCHRRVDFQLYRGRAASLSANEQSVMRVLATERNHWQALAPEHLAETVRITVEREALLGWQAGAEALEPALLLTRQDVDRRIKRLAEQDAHLLELNRKQC
jgi:hypothetical protein